MYSPIGIELIALQRAWRLGIRCIRCIWVGKPNVAYLQMMNTNIFPFHAVHVSISTISIPRHLMDSLDCIF